MFRMSSDNYYSNQISPAVGSNVCLDVQGANKLNGANVLTYTCSPVAKHQRFDVVPS